MLAWVCVCHTYVRMSSALESSLWRVDVCGSPWEWVTHNGTSCHADNSSSVKASAINLSRPILWKMTPVREGCGGHVFHACLRANVFLLCPLIPSCTCASAMSIEMKEEGLIECVWGRNIASRLRGFICLWFVVMMEHLIQQHPHRTHSTCALCRFFFFFFSSYTPPDMCEQTHWRKRTHIHTRMHAAGFMVPLSPGLLMERLPLINASFNDSPLKTGGRVIVCFSSSRAGKKWNDAEIYDVCSPVRQNY